MIETYFEFLIGYFALWLILFGCVALILIRQKKIEARLTQAEHRIK